MRSGRASAARPGSWGTLSVLVMGRLRLTGSGRIGEAMGSTAGPPVAGKLEVDQEAGDEPGPGPEDKAVPGLADASDLAEPAAGGRIVAGRWRATVASRGRGAMAARAARPARILDRPRQRPVGPPGAAQPGIAASEATAPGTDTGTTPSAATARTVSRATALESGTAGDEDATGRDWSF